MSDARVITLLTDFGSRDAYVGIMKGVMLGICSAGAPGRSHPRRAAAGDARRRAAPVERGRLFPAGTVHLAVVDPGVGSARDPVVVVTERALLVGPDNGLLAPRRRAARPARGAPSGGAAVLPPAGERHVPRPRRLRPGRGAPGGGRRRGRDRTDLCRRCIRSPARAAGRRRSLDRGEVIHVDHFGNLITNIPASALDDFPASKVSVRIGGVIAVPARLLIRRRARRFSARDHRQLGPARDGRAGRQRGARSCAQRRELGSAAIE